MVDGQIDHRKGFFGILRQQGTVGNIDSTDIGCLCIFRRPQTGGQVLKAGRLIGIGPQPGALAQLTKAASECSGRTQCISIGTLVGQDDNVILTA